MAEFENCDQISEEPNFNNSFQFKANSTVFQWTRNATNLLLDLYLLHKFDFRNSQIKKKQIWAQIKQTFIVSGFKNISEEVLDRKLRNMKSRYKSLKLNQSNAKNYGRITWEYFDQMDEIFYDDPILNIELTNLNNVPPPVDPLAIKFENLDSEIEHGNEDFRRKIQRIKRSKIERNNRGWRQIVQNNRMLVKYLRENNQLQKERNVILENICKNLQKLS